MLYLQFKKLTLYRIIIKVLLPDLKREEEQETKVQPFHQMSECQKSDLSPFNTQTTVGGVFK